MYYIYIVVVIDGSNTEPLVQLTGHPADIDYEELMLLQVGTWVKYYLTYRVVCL